MNRLDTTQGARLVVDALVHAGVTDVVVAPGSRSAPLMGPLLRAPSLRYHPVHDERSGAFLALGLVRSGRRAALITTSGTAVANAMPAVVEADADRQPLIVLTADRPPEAQGSDANQTIDQQAFFGGKTRCFLNLLPPEDERDPRAAMRRVAEALAVGTRDPKGPVHLNVMFRKPLEPTEVAYVRLDIGSIGVDPKAVDREGLAAVCQALSTAKRPLLVFGAAADAEERRSLMRLADAAREKGLSVVACALSGARDREGVASAFSLLHKAGVAAGSFDVVVWCGGASVSPDIAALVRDATYVFRIDDRVRRRFEHRDAQVVTASPSDLAAVLDQTPLQSRAAPDPLLDADRVARETLSELAREQDPRTLTEPMVARSVARAAKRSSWALFCGNSMPVRDVDLFADALPSVVLANRGASGIDGLLSTATGVALGAIGNTIALIGDTSFLHDAGALSSLPSILVRASTVEEGTDASSPALRVVVVDNRGGAIFDFLPIAAHAVILEEFLTQRHDVDFQKLCEAYGIPAITVDRPDALEAALASPMQAGLDVIIARVPPAGGTENVRIHRAIYERVRARVREGLGQP